MRSSWKSCDQINLGAKNWYLELISCSFVKFLACFLDIWSFKDKIGTDNVKQNHCFISVWELLKKGGGKFCDRVPHERAIKMIWQTIILFYVPSVFRMWMIMALYGFLSFFSLRNFFTLQHPSLSLICLPFTH